MNLKEKINLINFLKDNSQRETAAKFNTGTGSVLRINKRKEYSKMFEENSNEERLRKKIKKK